MGPACPYCHPKYFAPFTEIKAPDSILTIRKGSFFRKSDGRLIQRFQCLSCKRKFSNATLRPTYGQQKRYLNASVFKHLVSGVSMRRSAVLLKTTYKTIARKLVWLSRLENERHLKFMRNRYGKSPINKVQFDDMESFIHTKLKPVSIPLMVEEGTRLILGIGAVKMPAKGLLSKKSLDKYGKRPDHRRSGWKRLLKQLSPFIHQEAKLSSDQNPLYPSVIKRFLPKAPHTRHKSRKGCVVGQGELKRGGFDPLFSLNHTAAMYRANVNRLFRRTWCTSKRRTRLLNHLILYRAYHNRWIAKELRKQELNMIAA